MNRHIRWFCSKLKAKIYNKLKKIDREDKRKDQSLLFIRCLLHLDVLLEKNNDLNLFEF